MLSRRLCAAAICLFGLAPQAEATESSGLVRRASCTVVRFYVAKYTASAAEVGRLASGGLYGCPVLRGNIHGVGGGDVGEKPRGHGGGDRCRSALPKGHAGSKDPNRSVDVVGNHQVASSGGNEAHQRLSGVLKGEDLSSFSNCCSASCRKSSSRPSGFPACSQSW